MGEKVPNKAQPPAPLKANGNLDKNWCTWRSDFIEFMKVEDPTESYKNRWGTFLLMFIGPIGQEAYKKVSLDTSLDKENFDALLKKLDLYFIFGTKEIQYKGNITDYVNNLMEIAKASNHSDAQDIVKQKIINDIMRLKSDKDFETFLQSLNLSEIISECISLQKFTNQKDKKTNPEQTFTKKRLINNSLSVCVRCGLQHTRNKCPAHGSQCNNCKKFNHFTEKCKTNVKFVDNCSKCGTGHKQIECPAFGYACTKCGKNNHYSWKCQAPMVRNCSRCGTDHIISLCPAQGKECSRCKKPNHLETKCISK
ncbi:uncharacterized protein LOC128875129 [Hylaeus volcanicus]|uniref:uncharacterized protein LOC128875129 n=1 Tax=Hylaeus volcanicus TaxID=313075 RepID=UPI0023B7948C|nr:uncharacterized protein LOC128875129 [Hylaeus volcanicus]XP_053976468.1 uncharacterized protein LOC128875129 [Hylaeus volcanicus]